MTKRTSRQKAAELDEKGSRATQMQLAGHTLEEIALELGYSSHSGAFQAISRYKRHTQIMPIQEIMQITMARFECLLKAMWPTALAGDYKAFDRVLRVMAQEAKLLDLNGRDLL